MCFIMEVFLRGHIILVEQFLLINAVLFKTINKMEKSMQLNAFVEMEIETGRHREIQKKL